MNNQNFHTVDEIISGLRLARYSFYLAIRGGSRLSAYPSLGLRGLIGHQLQKEICPLPARQRAGCGKCFIREQCPYYTLYEKQSLIQGRTNAPKGYLFYAAPFQKGTKIEVELVLMGRSNELFPAICQALETAGATGLGLRSENRLPYSVERIEHHFPGGKVPFEAAANISPQAYSLDQWLEHKEPAAKARFITPVRLTKKRETSFDWSLFKTNLARRLENLNMVYGSGHGFGRNNWLQLYKSMQQWPKPSARLRWVELQRHSNRQNRKIPLGGFTGEVDLTDTGPEQQRWWQLASLLHVGRGTVMGLGRVELQERP
ncbi:MAG: hypothetical protein CSA20_08720 [Deltaproteobacteria bacterium]|nr:MAG: hypothetical protein CSA20_08720 [Deltaproteobacteria bacterium]